MDDFYWVPDSRLPKVKRGKKNSRKVDMYFCTDNNMSFKKRTFKRSFQGIRSYKCLLDEDRRLRLRRNRRCFRACRVTCIYTFLVSERTSNEESSSSN